MSSHSDIPAVNPNAKPSGTGCAECLESGGWWVHLRRCAACGHIGCCDTSPSQHGTKHYEATGHPIVQSFEPGEDWFFDYHIGGFVSGPRLAEPDSHPLDQPVPGPARKVPPNWQTMVHR